MVGACGAATSARAALLLGAAAVALVVLRIKVEERLLGADPSYVAYAARVRFRLVPGVW